MKVLAGSLLVKRSINLSAAAVTSLFPGMLSNACSLKAWHKFFTIRKHPVLKDNLCVVSLKLLYSGKSPLLIVVYAAPKQYKSSPEDVIIFNPTCIEVRQWIPPLQGIHLSIATWAVSEPEVALGLQKFYLILCSSAMKRWWSAS